MKEFKVKRQKEKFSLVALTLTLIAVFTIGRLSKELSEQGFVDGSYSVYSFLVSTTGLPPGSLVEMDGVNIGKLASVKGRQGKMRLVELKIENKYRMPSDSVLEVLRKGKPSKKRLVVNRGYAKKPVFPGEKIESQQFELDGTPIEKLFPHDRSQSFSAHTSERIMIPMEKH